jgi:pyruvate/2-oxoglutarate dehydrogenase complex dihydrolipoamide dehydrogenase (E3) component
MNERGSYPGIEFDQQAAGLLCPADYENPQPQDRYHLVIIGAGPAGLIAAIGAAGLGAKVALVEKSRMGGDCLNVGCVPSKALLEYTGSLSEPDFDGAFRWLRQVRAGIAPHDSVARYSEAGVDVFLGAAEFEGPGRVRVGDTLLDGRRIAICSGATADIPPIPGLAESSPLTNETVFDLTTAPESLAILGAGAIGCELALVFARLGVQVHLFELAERVLPLEIDAAGAAVAAALSDAGVQIHTGAGVSEVASADEGYVVQAGGQSYAASRVLVALGRRPNTAGLGLERIGVAVDDRGFIVTDAKLRTSNSRVYAAGDCTAALQFTHHADAQARALVQNTLFAPTARVDGLVVPHCTYTKPEVASVGAHPAVLTARGQAFDEYRFDFAELDRGRAELDGAGFAVVWTRRGSDEILGATIVGHDAGEQISPICILMSNKLGLSAAGKALFAYPTRSEYLKRLADAYNRSRLTPTVARLFKSWLGFTA